MAIRSFCMVPSDSPSERIVSIAEMLNPRIVLSRQMNLSLQAQIWDPSSPLESVAVVDDHHIPTNGQTFDSSTPAYIIMTSGSTGLPKPVVITRANLDALMQAPKLYSGRELWCAAILQVFGTLTSGGCLCIAPQIAIKEDLAGIIRRMKVEIINVTPTVAGLIADEKFDTLTDVTLGGEAVTPDLRDRLLRAGIRRVYNNYGPAECTVEVTRNPMDARSAGTKRVSMGKVFGSNVAAVVDDRLRPVPYGATGELCIGGPQVSPGYLGRDDLNSKAFVSIEVTPGRSLRMYKTGDVVRLVPDGTLDFVSRKDRQQKIRGQRVEPGEVETTIRRAIPEISQIAVVPLNDFAGEKILVAFVVIRSGAESDLAVRWDVACKQLLVAPTARVMMARLPMTPSAKLDMVELQAAYEAHVRSRLEPSKPTPQSNGHSNSTTDGNAALTPRLELVRGLWANIFGLNADQIDLDVRFSDLGGKLSLPARRLIVLDVLC
jgi:acyl-coenzyme A synthetase/AMP-(fatty) acid ligase